MIGFGNANSSSSLEEAEVPDISDISQEESVDEEGTAEYLLIVSESLTFTEIGEEQEIEYETNIENLSEIEWTTEDETTATVDQEGLVTAVGAGETVIYACWEELEISCMITCEIEEDESDSQFNIDSDTVSDYSANLDPDEYLYYDSPDFTFYYPASLYNYGTEDLESYTTVTGVNVRDVYLEGDDGVTTAHFNKSSRTDSGTTAELLQDVYVYYGSLLHGMSDISYSDEYSCFIITGYFDSAETEAAYILVRVNGEFVYCMEILFPYNGNSSSEDYLEKSYVVENIYRMCSFSGSSYKARTYTQFLNGEQGEKY
ncbi:MAG: Ig-like domain-containing protein [Clostridiales bacterium]|nr:Ig-like domain-containing protein [Clostridiales bacterium]